MLVMVTVQGWGEGGEDTGATRPLLHLGGWEGGGGTPVEDTKASGLSYQIYVVLSVLVPEAFDPNPGPSTYLCCIVL